MLSCLYFNNLQIDAIESGKVKIGGKPVSFDYKIKNNDFFEHTLHR